MAQCKGCGREIVWGKWINDQGKEVIIPLDAKAPCYEVADGDTFRKKNVYVSHFATCPDANKFSGSKK